MGKLEDLRGKIRLVAFDLDGTVLNSKKEVSPRTMEAMRRAAAGGIRLVTATGRQMNDIPCNVLPGIPGISYAVTANGALTYALPEGEAVFSRVFPAPDARRILSECRLFKAMLHVGYGKGGVLDDRGAAWEDPKARDGILALSRAWKFDFSDTVTEFAAWEDPPCKLTLIFFDPAERERAVLHFSKYRELTVSSSERMNLEIMPPNTHKGAAIAFLAAREGLSARQVMAIGDSHNDMDMLSAAGLGVAMGNGAPELKKMADFVTLSCDEDGVALAIEGIL
ncbi:MAG: Cof-type HAD-IIB family hydrolase [Clostridiaceae bacterium]|nr:Cof-type HAD-IIB family hydrolase [Eubacteriales bacterium]